MPKMSILGLSNNHIFVVHRFETGSLLSFPTSGETLHRFSTSHVPSEEFVAGPCVIPCVELSQQCRLTVSTNPNIIGKGSIGVVLVLVQGDLGTLENTHAMHREFLLEEGVTLMLAIGLTWDDVRTCVSITDSQDSDYIAVGFVLSAFPEGHRGYQGRPCEGAKEPLVSWVHG